MSSLEATIERVERLASSGAEADARALVSLLGDEDWQARRAAAEAIARSVREALHGTDAELYLFEELLAAVTDKMDTGRRAAAIAALEGIGERALPRLASGLQAASPAARIALAGIIGHAGGKEAVRLLAPLAQDADTNVATAAIAALGRTRETGAARLLLKRIEAGDDWLRFAAVGALGELGDSSAIGKLEKLLEEQLMQEAVSASLVEVGTLEAAKALARHLRAKNGALRPAVLEALVSLWSEERAAPLAMIEAVREASRSAFREMADGTTYSDLMRLMTTGGHGRAQVCLAALGWLGDARAVPVIAQALNDPSLIKTARQALAALAAEPEALSAMLHTAAIPANELALALNGALHPTAIQATARLLAEASDAETFELAASAHAGAREWLRQRQRVAPPGPDEAAALEESLREALRAASGRALPLIAETLGVLVQSFHPSSIEAILEQLAQTDAEDCALARLALLKRADNARAVEEAALAQRHPSPVVRMAAIEILGKRTRPAPAAELVQHLTDEAAGVRRATIRAMRHGTQTIEAGRALIACLADEDIWVRVEAITTLGLLFGEEKSAHELLHEALNAAHPLCRVAACTALVPHAEAHDWQLLSQLARRDALAEARRAAVQAFAGCTQPRTVLQVARHALRDGEWSVRRAGVEVLAKWRDAASQRLLLSVARDEAEAAAVRGAALIALARRDAAKASKLACRALRDTDPLLYESAYTALSLLARTRRAELKKISSTCAPRAANVIDFILSNQKSDE